MSTAFIQSFGSSLDFFKENKHFNKFRQPISVWSPIKTSNEEVY